MCKSRLECNLSTYEDKKSCRKNKSIKNNLKFVTQSSKSQPLSTNDILETSSLRLDDVRKLPMLNFDQQITKAETLWALTVARRGFTYNSCNNIGDVFRSMFPDSKIAEQFNMQSKKISYVISHGIGPYFHRYLIKQLKRCEKFVLCIDEQTNVQNKKQLDLLVKFWSYDEGLVVTRYFKFILLGHAQANVLQDATINCFKTDGIDLKRLLMLGRDNPSVNISLENLIDQEMKKMGGGLLLLGSCERARKQLNILTQQERETFFNDVRKIYHGIAQYFKLNLPLKNQFLRDIKILHHSLKGVQNADQIIRVARTIPQLLTDREIDHLRDEWLTYSIETIDEKWIIKSVVKDSTGNDNITYQRIDFYWNNVLSITTTDGRPKYPTLSKLVKNILIISHGNADVERGFSINENIIVSNRSLLAELSINRLRTTYDAVKCAGGDCVPIDKELLKAVQNSYSFYREELAVAKAAAERIEKEREEQENINEMYKQVLKQEEDLLVKQKKLQRQQQEANLIIADASAPCVVQLRDRITGAFKKEATTTTEALSSISTNILSYTSTVIDASTVHETPPNQASNLREALAAVVTLPTNQTSALSQTVNLSEASAAIATISPSQTLVLSQTLNLSATLDINDIDANNYSNDDLKNLLRVVLAENKRLTDQLNQQRNEQLENQVQVPGDK
ncbi:unnamed protein product [Rotaria sordida]|uniref:Uncharacterized protein n=2 Tax=Rotaria sordida TaxID=392033 RepID=A0A814Q739_9BILA|nr:unnamed protein product [Rotaria sordida]